MKATTTPASNPHLKPPAFTSDFSVFSSTIPTDPVVQYSPPPQDISVASTPINFHIFRHIVPAIYFLETNRIPDHRFTFAQHGDDKPFEYLSVENNGFNRNVIHQAQFGFTFQTTPILMALLSKGKEDAPPEAQPARQPPAEAIQRDAAMPTEPSPDHPDPASNQIAPLPLNASLLLQSVACLNLQVISNLLTSPSTWAFVIGLEPSPYFGYAGMEARVHLFTEDMNHRSFHLLGLARPEKDIPQLKRILTTLCPNFASKILGITADLSDEQHHTILGAMTSRVISFFQASAPSQPFFTPDSQRNERPPPLFPHELGKTSSKDMAALLGKYRHRILESWEPSQMQDITREYEELCMEMADRPPETPAVAPSLASFANAWAFAGSRFRSLRYFVGALATAYLFNPEKRVRVSITNLERSGKNEEDSFVAAEVILQARQFMELRTYLK